MARRLRFTKYRRILSPRQRLRPRVSDLIAIPNPFVILILVCAAATVLWVG